MKLEVWQEEIINEFIDIKKFNYCYLKCVLNLDVCIKQPCRCLNQELQFISQRLCR